jgi:hypothetical protein
MSPIALFPAARLVLKTVGQVEWGHQPVAGERGRVLADSVGQQYEAAGASKAFIFMSSMVSAATGAPQQEWPRFSSSMMNRRIGSC